MSLLELINQASTQIDRRDAEIIAQKIFGFSEVQIITQSDKKVPEELVIEFFRAVEKRKNKHSISEVFGVKNFYTSEFIVTNDVLTPRPETEWLVDWALNNYSAVEKIIDIGTGSGCIIISIVKELKNLAPKKNKIKFLATDISLKALAITEKNAKNIVGEGIINLKKSDLLEGIAREEIENAVIVTNLPYIPERDKNTMDKEVLGGDPSLALFSGEEGTDVYKQLFSVLPDAFYALAFEYDPPQTIFFKKLLAEKFPRRSVEFFPDLAGELRFGVVR